MLLMPTSYHALDQKVSRVPYCLAAVCKLLALTFTIFPILLTLNCDLYSSQTGPLMILALEPHICTLIPALNPKLKSDPYFVKQLGFLHPHLEIYSIP